MRLESAILALLVGCGCGCGSGQHPAAPRAEGEKRSATRPEPAAERPEPRRFDQPDIQLIRHACAGFDAAVKADAPPDRLLSHAAMHAIELGGEPVKLATNRWALLPPQGLLEEIDRYERESGASPDECAGLRAHLERMAIIAATH